MAKTNFGSLMVHGTHRHVILQAHANLGLPEGKPWDNGQPWVEGDNERFEAEVERIASNPQEVADAVERFGPEVQRREMAQSEQKWRIGFDAVEPFAWMRDVREPIPEGELATGKSFEDLTRREKAIVRAYAAHNIKVYGKSMDVLSEQCELIAGNKQSLLGAIAHDNLRKRDLSTELGLG